MTNETRQPTDEERRQAVCLVMGRAATLIRYAGRYVQCRDDAEDAYQRAMEIALTRAPVTEPARFLAWLYSVVRNEALAISGERNRQGLGRADDVAAVADAEAPHGSASPETHVEWRQRYRELQDGLGSLTEQQRSCVMLQTAGLSYARIAAVTGLSHRQIERAISRGRARLVAWEQKLSSGEACEELDPVIERVARGEATRRERRRIARHLRACGGCRAALRVRVMTSESLAALVPLALLADSVPLETLPDPGHAIAYWERISASALTRVGQLVTMAIEAPAAGLARVGGATLAVVVGAFALLPMAADGLEAGERGAAPEPIEVSAPHHLTGAARAAIDTAGAGLLSALRALPREAPITGARAPERPRRTRSAPQATVRVVVPPPSPPRPAPRRERSPVPAPPAGAAAEFGP